MKHNNPIFSLKNFRSFGEEGADFELAPITVLTGCNSAGKSSLVKALLLLSKQIPLHVNSFVPKIGGGLIDCTSDLAVNAPVEELKISSKELGLGRFSKVLNQYAKDGKISMAYRTWSDFLQEEVIVRRIFEAKEDVLNEGKLTSFTIEKADGTIIYKRFWSNDYEYYSFVDEDGSYQDAKGIKGWQEEENSNSILPNCEICADVCEYHALQTKLNLFKSEKISKKYSDWHEELQKRFHSLEKKISSEDINKYNSKTIEKWNNIKIFSYETSLSSGETDETIRKQHIASVNEEEVKQRIKNNFFYCVLEEVIDPSFIKDIAYIDSSSALVSRLYSVEDTNKMCVALNKLAKCGGTTGSFVNKWLERFEIANYINVEPTEEGIGIMAYTIKKGGDGEKEEKRLLADEGYGITQLVSLLLQIDNTIKGIPIITFDKDTFNEHHTVTYPLHLICVEEPEVHLHPKYQSLLADMFAEAYQKYNIHFVIETHSEYLIRRLQVMVVDKDTKIDPNDISLNYVEKDGNGTSYNRKIKIRDDGGLDGEFGEGFYDEADTLALELFRRKPILS